MWSQQCVRGVEKIDTAFPEIALPLVFVPFEIREFRFFNALHDDSSELHSGSSCTNGVYTFVICPKQAMDVEKAPLSHRIRIAEGWRRAYMTETNRPG